MRRLGFEPKVFDSNTLGTGSLGTAQQGVPVRGVKEVPFVKTPRPDEYGVAKRAPQLTDINQLQSMSSAQLGELFAHGRTPNPQHFKGEMRGLALAAPHHDHTALGGFVNWVMTKIPPWKGKNALSAPTASDEGHGKNRILGGLLCPFEWNVVDTKFGRDLAGDKAQVIRLDYATPKSFLNAVTGIRSVHDELREVGPPGSGVYLGMAGLADHSKFWTPVFNALLKLAGREERVSKDAPPVPIIYFALQGN
ncbi:MAG: hypothetical protein U1E65_34220 [Myxococcota bacterium]